MSTSGVRLQRIQSDFQVIILFLFLRGYLKNKLNELRVGILL